MGRGEKQKSAQKAKLVCVLRSSQEETSLSLPTKGSGGCRAQLGAVFAGGWGSEGIWLMHPSIRLGCQKTKPLPSLSEERPAPYLMCSRSRRCHSREWGHRHRSVQQAVSLKSY